MRIHSDISIFVLQYVADTTITKLVQGIRSTMANPESASAQLALINAAQDMIPVSMTNILTLIFRCTLHF